MEIAYCKESLIKIKGKFDPVFLSSLTFSSKGRQVSFVKIIINFANNSKTVFGIDKFSPDILISPISQQPPLPSIKMQEKDYFNQVKNKELCFFELLKKKDDRQGMDAKTYFIQEPGEYEIKNTYIKSIACEQNAYVVEIEKIKICCFWGVPEKELTIDQLSQINSVDILIFPYSNEILKDYDRVSNFIHQIDPSLTIIVEMLYNNSITEIETCEDDVDIDEPHCSAMKDFIKQIGEEKVIFVDKFKIQKKDIIQTNKNFIFLKAINNKQ